jgi:ABC-type antimicrobial peptide transport system permease subunit
MALGATRAQVTRMVLRQSATLAAAGAAVGALAAFRLSNAVAGSGWLWRALSRTMGMLNLSDPTGYIVGCSVVLAAAVAASWIPARRAVRMDPAQTLRCD